MANRLTPINLTDTADIRVVNDNFQLVEQMIDATQNSADAVDTKIDTEISRATSEENAISNRLTIAESDIATNASAIDSKQDPLTPGTNITIDSNNVISATDVLATWGNISGDIDNQTDLQEALENKVESSTEIKRIVKTTQIPTPADSKTLYVLVEPWKGLKFTATQDNSRVQYGSSDTMPDVDMFYSLNDGVTWTSWGRSIVISLNNGESICVWNKKNTLTPEEYYRIFSFQMEGLFKASGNIMSMVNFSALSPFCFNGLFGNCTALTTAPELPATQLATKCYRFMFTGCSALTSLKIGYTGNFDSNYFSGWVSNVSPTGTFYYNGLDTTRGTSAIPTGWTVQTF